MRLTGAVVALHLSLVVGLAHMTQGNVDFGLAGLLLLGGIPGVLVGSFLRFSSKYPVETSPP